METKSQKNNQKRRCGKVNKKEKKNTASQGGIGKMLPNTTHPEDECVVLVCVSKGFTM